MRRWAVVVAPATAPAPRANPASTPLFVIRFRGDEEKRVESWRRGGRKVSDATQKCCSAINCLPSPPAIGYSPPSEPARPTEGEPGRSARNSNSRVATAPPVDLDLAAFLRARSKDEEVNA